MRKIHRFKLSSEERTNLLAITQAPRVAAKKVIKAQALLRADESAEQGAWTDSKIMEAIPIKPATLERLRKRCCEVGPLEALQPKRRTSPPRKRILDGEREAKLITLACSKAPDGRKRWTLRLLADRMIELEYVDAVSYETVRKKLKENKLKPWLKSCWCIPPDANAEFVAHMEDILDVYQRPYDPKRPVVP